MGYKSECYVCSEREYISYIIHMHLYLYLMWFHTWNYNFYSTGIYYLNILKISTFYSSTIVFFSRIWGNKALENKMSKYILLNKHLARIRSNLIWFKGDTFANPQPPSNYKHPGGSRDDSGLVFVYFITFGPRKCVSYPSKFCRFS